MKKQKETNLAKYIEATQEKAAYDAACKRLLANKNILAWLMKSCLEEYQNCEIKEIAMKYIEGDPQVAQMALYPDEIYTEQVIGLTTEDKSLREGTVTYDIRFTANVPTTGEPIKLIINVEAQNDFYPGYPLVKRGLYYCSRMISSQYETEFTATHYEKIKKVYSIWICMNPPKERQNTITRYQLTEENIVGKIKEKKANYDLMTVIMVCLGNENKENHKGILRLLEVLLSNEKQANEKKKILSEDFEIAMTKILEKEVQEMCNLSKGVEERGIEKGKIEGRTEALYEVAAALLDILDDEMIAQKTGLSIEEVRKIRFS
jgi:predicted transposase/invertase (TIGR01784 family)